MASEIARKRHSLGMEFLGNPTGPEKGSPDGIGRYDHFQHGSIYWSPSTGARAVHGAIRSEWASLGWEGGWLGQSPTVGAG